MITEYLMKSLIYFIIIGASMYMLKCIHPDIKGGGTTIGAIFKWGVLCLIPFLRAIVVLLVIVLILIPGETLKKINEKKEEK